MGALAIEYQDGSIIKGFFMKHRQWLLAFIPVLLLIVAAGSNQYYGVFVGTHSGDGSGLSNVVASSIAGNPLTNYAYLPGRVGGQTLYGARGNLVVNGDMELDSDWASYGSPSQNTRSDIHPHAGTYSRIFTSSGTADGIKSDVFQTVGGVGYTVSLWAGFDSAGPDGSLNIKIRNGDDSGWAVDTNMIVGGPFVIVGYTNLIVTYSDTGPGPSGYIVFNSTDTAGDFTIDDVSISGPPGNLSLYSTTSKNGRIYLGDNAYFDEATTNLYIPNVAGSGSGLSNVPPSSTTATWIQNSNQLATTLPHILFNTNVVTIIDPTNGNLQFIAQTNASGLTIQMSTNILASEEGFITLSVSNNTALTLTWSLTNVCGTITYNATNNDVAQVLCSKPAYSSNNLWRLRPFTF